METVPAPLKGKVAIVTGGSRGIGAGIALAFARQGCTHIAITYLTNKALAENVLASIAQVSPAIKTTAFSADCRDPEFGSYVVSQTLTRLDVDRLDIVVSNAAPVDVREFSPVEELTKEAWDRSMTEAAWAPLSLAKAAITHMPRGGRIVMLSSGVSKLANGDPLVAHAAAKAAMDAVSRNLGAIFGVKYGVTVNSISVGTTRTDATETAFREFGPAFEKYATEFSLLKRVGEVEEVANIVAFVASPQASWIISNQIPANGGGLSMLQS